jgi:putative redox protein
MKLHVERIESPFVFEVNNEKGAKVIIDASAEIGGKNQGLTPMQLLAGSLAGCMSIDVISILNKQKIEPNYFAIEIQATKKEGQPSPFENIKIIFIVNKEVPHDKLEKAIILSKEKYCSVYFSLNEEIEINYTIECREQ